MSRSPRVKIEVDPPGERAPHLSLSPAADSSSSAAPLPSHVTVKQEPSSNAKGKRKGDHNNASPKRPTKVKKESAAQSSASSRSSTRVKREVNYAEPNESDMNDGNDDDDDGALQQGEEESVAADGDGSSSSRSKFAAPHSVDLDRVRIKKPNGDLDAVPKVAPWRIQSSSKAHSSSSSAAAAASSSSSSSSPYPKQSVVYWMTREQRADDNWVLLYAQQLAREHSATLRVVFCLVPTFLEATDRQYQFMLKGLAETEQSLKKRNIPFEVLIGYAYDVLPEYALHHRAGAVVTCFGPLRISKDWTKRVATGLEHLSCGPVPLYMVDGHNIVPMWIASDKLEYAARTIRPKIHKHLNHFLTEFIPVQHQDHSCLQGTTPIDWKALDASLRIDRTVKEVPKFVPGSEAGLETLHGFIRNRLAGFATKRNNPNEHYSSDVSPYLHFGQLAPQRAALEVEKLRRSSSRMNESINSFIEELVVRRELSDNFCFYNEKYDSVTGASQWAQDTLRVHTADKRDHLYTLGEFEYGVTHDELWNAAQLQLTSEGKMHGFLRMYWAKKILEWTKTPEEALKFAIYLNDRYHIDGRDPNGYVGCAWSIIGIHDMGWTERRIFGKIRFMNFEGCKRKFDVPKFINQYKALGSVVGSPQFVQNQAKAKEKDAARGESSHVSSTTTSSSSSNSSSAPAAAASVQTSPSSKSTKAKSTRK